MANQPAPPRPWFRLPSIARPAPEPAPTPTPEPPRPPLARPAFRPATQPASSAASLPVGGVASVPTSPARKASAPSASLPTSPVPATTGVAPVTTSASVPSSPRPRVSAPTSSLPPSPSPKPAPSSPVSTSPAPKPVPTSPVPKIAPITSSVPASPTSKATATSADRVPSREASTRNKPSVQSPPQSPKPTLTAPPPSPLILPSAKIRAEAGSEAKIPLEAEQKSVLVQKTVAKPKPAPNGSDSLTNLVDAALKTSISRHGKQEPSKDDETKEKGQRKKIYSDSEDMGMRVITIAGENKGAFMEVIRSPNKKHVFEGNKWVSYSSSSSGEEGKTKTKDKGHKGRTISYPPMTSFMNSNVQGVNNSIMYDSSCTLHDPGVHLTISRKPGSGWFKIKDRSDGKKE